MRVQTLVATSARCRLATLLTVAALASGCAGPAPRPDAGTGESRWSGRFAAGWTDGSDPPRSERASGRFELASDSNRTRLEVRSPLGQTLVRAEAGTQGASIETADGRRFSADTAEALTEIVLGWRIPMLRLPVWLAEGGPDRTVDGDWEVLIESRAQQRPQRLNLRWPAAGSSAEGRSVSIRLLVDETSAGSAP